MNKLKGKIILILGGTGGIGSQVANLAEAQGAFTIRHGTNGPYGYDVRSEKGAADFINRIIGEYGRVDGIVNALSAPVKVANIDKKTWGDFFDHLNIQLKSAVDIEGGIIPFMKEQGGGRIVHILTSYTMGVPPASIADYITAKYAMLGLTRVLAKELGSHHITVNAVSPGYIRNKFNARMPEKLAEIIATETPLRSLTTEEDTAHAVLFLLSDDASHITGENINISGGHSMG